MERIDKVFHLGFDFTSSEKWNLVRLAYASRWVEKKNCEEFFAKAQVKDPG
jgi:hypothetical protein